MSEAHFIVRSQGGSSSSGSSGGGSLSSLFGGSSGGQQHLTSIGDSMTVDDYLQSHDAVEALQKRLDLVTLFRRPGTDLLSRMMVARPTPEYLLGYYQRQVQVQFDSDTGITTLTARAFRPEDAYAIATQLLLLGEGRVNEMNVRSYSDAVSLTKRQMEETERSLRAMGVQGHQLPPDRPRHRSRELGRRPDRARDRRCRASSPPPSRSCQATSQLIGSPTIRRPRRCASRSARSKLSWPRRTIA